MANLIDDMKDYSTNYTKNGFERAFGEDEIKIVWNNKYVNAVKKIDLPSVFHDDALQSTFVGDVLPARYFGEANAHTTAVAGDRATHDLYLTISNKTVYVAAGDKIPADLKANIDSAVSELETAVRGDSKEAIEAAEKKLNDICSALAQYTQQGTQGQPNAEQAQKDPNNDAMDAEFEEVKDDK